MSGKEWVFAALSFSPADGGVLRGMVGAGHSTFDKTSPLYVRRVPMEWSVPRHGPWAFMSCVSTSLSLTFVPCVLAPHSSSCLVRWCRYDEGAARVHTPASNPVVIGASTPAGQDAYCGLLHDLRVGPSSFSTTNSATFAGFACPELYPCPRRTSCIGFCTSSPRYPRLRTFAVSYVDLRRRADA